MRAKGGRVLAISVDAPELSRRVVEDDELAFPILSDATRETIRAYGLVHAGGGLDEEDIALPAQLLVAEDGRIVWSHVARRIQGRVSPARTLEAIERL